MRVERMLVSSRMAGLNVRSVTCGELENDGI